MKQPYLIFLTIYLTTTFAHYEKHNCGSNQVYVTCGSGCEATCKNPKPKACTLQCVDGCRCKAGYIRNDRNECVKQCGVTQHQPASHPYVYRPPPPVLAPPQPQPVVVIAPPPPPPRRPANCWDLLCPQGMMCSMVQERCLRYPCPPPVPKCVMGAAPVTTTPRPVTPIAATCSDLICPKGMSCGEVMQNCKRAPCHPNLQCMAPPASPPLSPKSCAMVRCATGMVCQMVQDPCMQTPCPSPTPRCVVASAPPTPPPSCSNFDCATGTHCEMRAPKCTHSPCQEAVPKCVQNYVAPPPPRPHPIVIPVLVAGH